MTYVYIAIIMLVFIVRFKNKRAKKKFIENQKRERNQQVAMQKTQKKDTKKYTMSEKAYIDMAEIWVNNPARKTYADF